MRRISKKYLVIIVVLIAGLVFLNFISNIKATLGNTLFIVFSPVERFFIGAGDKVVGFFELILSIKELGKENSELRNKNLELESQITELRELKRENQLLREVLNLSEKNQFVLELASITGKDIYGLEEWILIDKGAKNGIEKNMAVISKDFALVGKTIEVMTDFSKVRLITNKDSIVAAIIEGQRSQGVVEIGEKGRLFIDFIPRNEKLNPEERVITSGMDGCYPKGILIGKIESIDLSQNQLFQKITIIPAVDFSKLEEVFIIK